MRTLRAWIVRFVALLRPNHVDADLGAEIESHLQHQTDAYVQAGMSPEQARRAALLRMGGVESVKEQQRDRAGLPRLQNIGRDFRYAVRVLRRNPTFTIVTVLTLALGIGANTAIFNLVNAVLLRPLPYADAERLALISAIDAARSHRETSLSYPDFEAWGGEAHAFDAVAAMTSRPATLGGGDQPELVPAIQATAGFFRVLQIEPVLGRTFSEADAAPGAQPAAVLSDSAWRRQFGGRGDIIGHIVSVNSRPHVVIGIVPGSMHFIPTESEQVYTLLPRETDRAHMYLRMVARLRPNASFQEAQSQLDVLARRAAEAFPETNATTGARIVPLVSAVGAPLRDGLLILLGLVGAVLLIACSNVANLLLARNASRQHELALRMSLGAGRARIVQQLLAESLVLALAGGAAGLAVAEMLTRGLVAMLDGAVPVPRLERVQMDVTVLAFAVALSLVTGLLFGVVPAILGTPAKLQAAVRDVGRTVSGSRKGRRTRAGFVVLETALALILLAASAMLARTFVELRATPSGFVADDVLVVAGRLPAAMAPGAPREAFFEQVRARVERLRGVRSAGIVSNLPMAGGGDSLQFRAVDRPGAKPASATFNIAGPGYFRTMRIPVRGGREFVSGDNSAAPAVVVINETAARRFWPDMDPVGRRIVLTGRPTEFTIVGITGDVRQSDLATTPRAEIFLCSLQPGPEWANFALVVHTERDPIGLAPDVRAVMRSVDPNVAIAKVGTMHDVLAGRLAQPRIYTVLLGAFAVLALVLATVGLYGVVSYSVAQRTRELGIRLALGSSPSALVGGVLREGAVLIAGGTVIGVAGAYAATQGVATLLPGSRPGDPLTLTAAALLMLIVGSVATYLPALRAARVDPLTALRSE